MGFVHPRLPNLFVQLNPVVQSPAEDFHLCKSLVTPQISLIHGENSHLCYIFYHRRTSEFDFVLFDRSLLVDGEVV